jgi:hypothetical protein
MQVASKWLCGLLVAALTLTTPLLSRVAVVAAAELSSQTAPVDVEVTDADRVATGFLNVGYVPGKAIVCGLGTVATVGVMITTLGSAYRAAKATFNEGCGGTWVLTPEQVAGKVPPRGELD